MSIFSKKTLESISALKGVEAQNITAEQIVAVNSELSENDVKGIEVNAVGALATLNGELATANTSIEDLRSQLVISQETIEAKDAMIADLNAKLKAVPGAEVEEIVVGDDKITPVEGSEDDIYKSTSIADEFNKTMGI